MKNQKAKSLIDYHPEQGDIWERREPASRSRFIEEYLIEDTSAICISYRDNYESKRTLNIRLELNLTCCSPDGDWFLISRKDSKPQITNFNRLNFLSDTDE